MRRLISLMCVAGVCFACFAQDNRVELEKRRADAEKLAKLRREAYLKLHPTEVPDLVNSDLPKELKLPPKLEIGKDDSAQQRAAKRALEAGRECSSILLEKFSMGQSQGSTHFFELMYLSRDMSQVLPDITESSAEHLKWKEYQLQLAWFVECNIEPRVRANVEPQSSLFQTRMLRNKSEIEVLKLREKAKK